MDTATRHIDIPIKDSQGEVVEVDVADLPDASEIIGILAEEEATRALYHRFSLEYYKQARFQDFVEIIQAGIATPSSSSDDLRDKIPLHNSLAAHYINQLSSGSLSQQERKSLGDLATLNFNASDRIHMQQIGTWVGKAMLLLARDRFDQASYLIKSVLDSDPHNIPALFGKAAILYQQKDYLSSLACYQLVLRLKPRCKTDPRIGIGLCYYQLGDYSGALYALNRALSLDAANVHLLLILTSICYNMAKMDTRSDDAAMYIRLASEHLKSAQKLDKSNALVSLFLSEFVFQKGLKSDSLQLFQKSVAAALSGLKSAPEQPQFRGYLSFCAGRGYHAMRNFPEAHRYYQQASPLVANLPCIKFYLAQTFLQRGEIKNGIDIVEGVAREDAIDKVLAFLYSKDENFKEKSIEILRKLSLEKHPDIDSLVKLAEALEQSAPEESLKYYRQVNTLFAAKNEVSLQLLNNMAALHYQLREFEEAEKTWEASRNICESFLEGEERDEHVALYVTLSWNLARLYEDLYSQQTQKALDVYEEVLGFHAGYVDAWYRKGIIAQKQGNYEKALECYNKGISIDKKSAEGWILIGSMELERKGYRESKVAFDTVLRNLNSRDLYCLVAAGNDRLLAARGESKPAAKDEFYTDAAKFFDKVLHLNSKCVYAANGIGIALAETGNFAESRDVFSAIRSSLDSCPSSTLVNLAHVFMELGQYKMAIPLYEMVSKKQEAQDVTLMTYCARAYYISARTSKSSEEMAEAVGILEKLFKIAPADLAIRFNLALALQQYAQLVSDKTEDSRDLAELHNASEAIDGAEAHFRALKDMGSKAIGYDPAMAGQREKHCIFVRNAVIRQLSQQRANAELKKEKMDEILRMREIEENKKKQLLEEQEAQRLALEAKILQTRETLNAELQKQQENMVAEAAEPSKKKKRAATTEEDGAPKRKRKAKSSTADQSEDESKPTPTTKRGKKLRRPVETVAKLSEEMVDSASENEEDQGSPEETPSVQQSPLDTPPSKESPEESALASDASQ